jgi:hypothetical protein
MQPSNFAVAKSLACFALVLLSVGGCGGIINPNYALPNICKQFDDTPLTPLSAPNPNDPAFPKSVFEVAGQIKVMHGFGSAKVDNGNKLIKVEQSVSIPSFANRATVFLNGWRLEYLSSDHHVLAAGAVITKIKLDLRALRLSWTAAGLLRDNDFNDGYKFTYQYTVIAWASGAMNLTLDQGSPDNFCNSDTDLPDKAFVTFNTGTRTALSSFSVFSQITDTSINPVGVLPRGFAFAWYDSDHHLYQLAYNLDHSEIFAEAGKIYSNNKSHVHTAGDLMSGIAAPLPGTSNRVDSGFVSWNTYAIFKDDSSRRDYIFGEMVSTLGGSNVRLIQPPFSILPTKGQTSGLIPGGGVETKDVTVDAVPFAFAIPMLTGWDLAYISDAQHVKEVGIWLEDWSYTPGGGTLTYTVSSVLRDKDSVPGHYPRHKITILGLQPNAQPVAPKI